MLSLYLRFRYHYCVLPHDLYIHYFVYVRVIELFLLSIQIMSNLITKSNQAMPNYNDRWLQI